MKKKTSYRARVVAPKVIPITRPTLQAPEKYLPLFRKVLKNGMLTTDVHVRELEEKVARYVGVKHCIAVSSCTSGLMLSLKGLGLSGEVIVPSFTFAATAHPILWNNLQPVFADIDPATFTLDPKSVEKLITPRTSAIVATHVFGVPCDVAALERIARRHKLKLVFDAAHAFGATHNAKPIGSFGDVEVFSMSPIKLLTAAEGGLVTTNNDALAAFVRMGRNYGDDGTNNTLFAGLSARMSEFHAAIGLLSFGALKKNLKRRQEKAQYLMDSLKKLEPNLQFQSLRKEGTTTHYIFGVVIDAKKLGYTRDQLFDFFKEKGILTRKYFYPPLHRQPTYASFAPASDVLPVTNRITDTILALPLYSHLSKADMHRIISAYAEFKKGVNA